MECVSISDYISASNSFLVHATKLCDLILRFMADCWNATMNNAVNCCYFYVRAQQNAIKSGYVIELRRLGKRGSTEVQKLSMMWTLRILFSMAKFRYYTLSGMKE